VSKNGDSEIKGNVTATSFVKKDGTSSQFLKADGSVDSSRIHVVDINTAIGTNSFISNTDGFNNTAIGESALRNNNVGINNTAIGTSVLRNNGVGNNNTGLGLNALLNNGFGNNNTGLGYSADVSSDNLTNATAIGYNAIVNTSNTIQLGDTNVTMVNTSAGITANSFVKSGGLNTQYLMGDGSTLTQSANSGNSNYYVFKTGGTGTSPSSGYITWGDFQYSATKVYVSKTTTDDFDITPFVKDLSQLNDLYLQKKSSAGTYIRYNITEVKSDSTRLEFTVVSPPVENSSDFTSSSNGFAEEDQLLVSFFSNLAEADTRLSSLESVVAVSGETKTVTATSFVKSGGSASEFLKANGSVDSTAYLPLSGGTLTGQVLTSQTPTLGTHVTNKTYVDSAVSTGGGAYVPLAGNVTLTGPLTMGTNAINTTQSTFTSGQLVSKNYVDNATTFTRCTTGDLGLRMIRGYVSRTGTYTGVGFTATRTALGSYTVTFTNNFTSAPTAMITPVNTIGDNTWVFAMVTATTTSSFSVAMINSSSSNRADMEFNFLVIGTN